MVDDEKEALATRNGREAVVLAGRTGFISLACKYGYTLVPTYAFGQNETFTVSDTTLGGLQTWLQRTFKVSIPIFYGVYGTPLPHPVQITLAVGKPIKMPKLPSSGDGTAAAEPSAQVVEQLHKEYVASLRTAFEKHKAGAGYGDRELQVLDLKGKST